MYLPRYLAVAYAIKYPTHLIKLILISPVGIPCSQYAINCSSRDEHLDRQLQHLVFSILRRLSFKRSNSKQCYQHVPCFLHLLWWMNISPFTLVRLSGPFGPMLASAWTSDISATFSPTEARYFNSIFTPSSASVEVVSMHSLISWVREHLPCCH